MSLERIAPEQYDSIQDVPEPVEHPHLFGHAAEASELASAYRSGKFHHALILSGPRGIGKATLAFRLAHHIFAHPRQTDAPEQFGQPHATATLFRLMAQGAHPSLLHLTRPAAERSFRTVVTVNEIRRVNRFLSMTAHDGGYRIVIVDAADDMNRSAANALLKNLEEPPPRTLFVLIVHSIGRMLPTIRSRCQMIKLKPLPAGDLLAALDAVSPEAPAADAEALVARAQGSVRDALLLTSFGGLEVAEAIDRVLAGSELDIAGAHRIADAVAGRDSTVQFQIFNEHITTAAETRARAAAARGLPEEAARLAGIWMRLREAVTETETYNLDRRQHVVGLLDQMVRAR